MATVNLCYLFMKPLKTYNRGYPENKSGIKHLKINKTTTLHLTLDTTRYTTIFSINPHKKNLNFMFLLKIIYQMLFSFIFVAKY